MKQSQILNNEIKRLMKLRKHTEEGMNNYPDNSPLYIRCSQRLDYYDYRADEIRRELYDKEGILT